MSEEIDLPVDKVEQVMDINAITAAILIDVGTAILSKYEEKLSADISAEALAEGIIPLMADAISVELKV